MVRQKGKQIQFEFSKRDLETIDQIAEKYSITRAEVIRSALENYEYFLRSIGQNRTIVVENEKGKVTNKLNTNLFLK